MTPTLSHYTVLNAMQVGVIDCPPDTDVKTLARTMADHRIHCVVVRGAPWASSPTSTSWRASGPA